MLLASLKSLFYFFITEGGAEDAIYPCIGIADFIAELFVGEEFGLDELEGIEFLRAFFIGVFRVEEVDFLVAKAGEGIGGAKEFDIVGPVARLFEKLPLAAD